MNFKNLKPGDMLWNASTGRVAELDGDGILRFSIGGDPVSMQSILEDGWAERHPYNLAWHEIAFPLFEGRVFERLDHNWTHVRHQIRWADDMYYHKKFDNGVWSDWWPATIQSNWTRAKYREVK